MIMTVRGPVPKEELGICSSHEHIFIDMRGCVDITGQEPASFYEPLRMENRCEVFADPYAILDNALQSGLEDAVEEVRYFKEWGGQTIVDCTPDEIGRDPLALKEVSERTGVHIVLGCGHYYDKAHFPYVAQATVEELAAEMRKDLLVGIQDTGIRAGLIGEIGTSAVITPSERKVLQAAGMVGAETGKAIHVHTDLYTENGFEVIRVLTAEGVKPEKICIDHVDVDLRPEYIKALLDLGAYVEFDNFGKEFYTSKRFRFAYDLERIRLLKELLDAGYGSRIMICNDICLKSMWKKYGGNGYAHILRTVKRMALENGIREEQFVSLLRENVRDFLA